LRINNIETNFTYISTKRTEKKSFNIRRTSNEISIKVIDTTIKSPKLPVEIIVV
jgi:hypothetical protein